MKKAFIAAVVALSLAATMALAGCQSASKADQTSNDQEAIKKDLTTNLDAVKQGNVPGLDELLKESGVLNGIDVDTAKFIEAYTNGFTYEIGDIKVNESAGTATASVKVSLKAVDDIVAEWGSNVSNSLGSLTVTDFTSASSDVSKTLSDSLLKAIETTAPIEVDTVTFTYTKASDGTWQMDDFAQQVYQALGLDSVGSYANLLSNQLGLGDLSELGNQLMNALK